jgi:hypothetical protein
MLEAPSTRSTRFEIWSRTLDGSIKRHGVARGLTFVDACKQLASESVDFWKGYDDKGKFQGYRLHSSRAEAGA